MIDRSDAVNLARQRVKTGCTLTEKGIDVLADAVMAMDEYIRNLTSPEEKRGTYDLSDIETFSALAASAALQAAFNAIDAEPEVPGPMPDEMWAAINGDRDACENAIRIAIRQTKSGITNRLLAHEPSSRQPQNDLPKEK